jgi:hypothetical protein
MSSASDRLAALGSAAKEAAGRFSNTFTGFALAIEIVDNQGGMFTPELRAIVAFNAVYDPNVTVRICLGDFYFLRHFDRFSQVPVLKSYPDFVDGFFDSLAGFMCDNIDNIAPSLLMYFADELRAVDGGEGLSNSILYYLDKKRPRKFDNVWFVRGLLRRFKEDPSRIRYASSVLMQSLLDDSARGQMEKVLHLARNGINVHVIDKALLPLTKAIKVVGSPLEGLIEESCRDGLYVNFASSCLFGQAVNHLARRGIEARSFLGMSDNSELYQSPFVSYFWTARLRIADGKKIVTSTDERIEKLIVESMVLSGSAIIERGVAKALPMPTALGSLPKLPRLCIFRGVVGHWDE